MKKILLTLCLFITLDLSGLSERYQLVNLGINQSAVSEANAINDRGQVCGSFVDGDKNYAFFWDPRKKLKIATARFSSIPRINNEGKIFGSFITRKVEGLFELDQETTYIWNVRSIKDNFTYPGFPSSQISHPFDVKFPRILVWDANDRDQVLMMNSGKMFEDPSFGKKFMYRIWVFENETFHEITSSAFTIATKINNHGDILVQRHGYNKLMKIVCTQVGIYSFKNSSVSILDFSPSAVGYDLNEQGQIAGEIIDPLTKTSCGFLVDKDGSNLLVFNDFIPRALNNHGVLIGEKDGKPAIWDNGCLRLVSDLLEMVDDNGNVWDSVVMLRDVNDSGEIVGEGVYNGIKHGVLLRPVVSARE